MFLLSIALHEIENTAENIDSTEPTASPSRTPGNIGYCMIIDIYTTIHINEAISLVIVRALLEYRSRMTSHNNKT